MTPSARTCCTYSACLLLSIIAFESASAQTKRGTSTALAHSILGTPPAMDSMAMPLVAPVFLQTDQVDSSITVVNSIIWSIQGTVTLRNQQGSVIATSTPTFPAHSSTVLSLKTLLATAGSLAHSGSVTIQQDPAIKGPALLAQLSMTMHVGSQSAFLEEEFGMPTPHGSTALRGVASETQNLPLIAVTSVSSAPQTLSASCIGETTPSAAVSIELPAYGTTVVHACQWDLLTDGSLGLSSALLQNSNLPSLNHAVSLKTDAAPGSFYAFGFALNGGVGQPALQPLDFYDPGTLPSTRISYVGVPVGLDLQGLHASFSPILTLANFSGQVRTTTVTIADSSSGTPRVYQAAQVTLPALSTQTIHVPVQAGTGLLNTFTINSDGSPGDVQAHLFANRDSSQDRLELLAKDSQDDHNAGDHPWSLEGGNKSTLLLYNPTTTPQKFQVRVSGDGSSWAQLYTLAPAETRAISISDIVKNQTQDLHKQVLPGTLLNGEVQWSTGFGASGLGRLLVTNPQTALKRNFSCSTYINLCGAAFGAHNFSVFLDGTDTDLATISVISCTEYCPNCCGQSSPTGPQYDWSTSWQGGDSAQTRVTGSNNTDLYLQGIAPGSFYIGADVTEGGCQSSTMAGGGTVQACQTPSGESTSPVRQAVTPPTSPTATDFIQTLTFTQSGTADDGATISEAENEIGTDTCYSSLSPYLAFTSVTNDPDQAWTVGGITPNFAESQVVTPSSGQWGPDLIGFQPGPVRWYQQNNPKGGKPIPCASTLHQSLSLTCPRQSGVAFANEIPITSTIDASGLTNCREGVCAAHYPYN